MDTVNLVATFQHGTTRAASELFQRHLPMVREIVRVRLGKNDQVRRWMDSEDVLQESLLKACTGLKELVVTETGQFIAWLSRIVENTIIDAAKAVQRQKRDLTREVRAGLDLDELVSAQSSMPTPSQVAMGREKAELYFASLEQLDERYREAILLRRHAECSFAEIARSLGLANEGQARATLSRALAALGTRMHQAERRPEGER